MENQFKKGDTVRLNDRGIRVCSVSKSSRCDTCPVYDNFDVEVVVEKANKYGVFVQHGGTKLGCELSLSEVEISKPQYRWEDL